VVFRDSKVPALLGPERLWYSTGPITELSTRRSVMACWKVICFVIALGIALTGCRQYREYEKLHDDLSAGGYYQSKTYRDLDKFNRSFEPAEIYRKLEVTPREHRTSR